MIGICLVGLGSDVVYEIPRLLERQMRRVLGGNGVHSGRVGGL